MWFLFWFPGVVRAVFARSLEELMPMLKAERPVRWARLDNSTRAYAEYELREGRYVRIHPAPLSTATTTTSGDGMHREVCKKHLEVYHYGGGHHKRRTSRDVRRGLFIRPTVRRGDYIRPHMGDVQLGGRYRRH